MKTKNSKGWNKKIVATIGPNEYKDVLLKNKCLRLSVNRIQSKDHGIGASEINKSSNCLVLMTKCIFKTMDMAYELLDIRLNYEKELY